MKKNNKNNKKVVYTTDGSGFVAYHSINSGLYSLLREFLRNNEEFIKYSILSKITYDTLKSNYEFLHGIKLPYYY